MDNDVIKRQQDTKFLRIILLGCGWAVFQWWAGCISMVGWLYINGGRAVFQWWAGCISMVGGLYFNGGWAVFHIIIIIIIIIMMLLDLLARFRPRTMNKFSEGDSDARGSGRMNKWITGRPN